MVAPRCPSGSKLYGPPPPPRTLLFGAAASALRYNCFSRIMAALANRFLGLPVLNYFDDFGCPLPGSLCKGGLRIFSTFSQEAGALLEGRKSLAGRQASFLGLPRVLPGPGQWGDISDLTYGGQKTNLVRVDRCSLTDRVGSPRRVGVAYRAVVILSDLDFRPLRAGGDTSPIPEIVCPLRGHADGERQMEFHLADRCSSVRSTPGGPPKEL